MNDKIKLINHNFKSVIKNKQFFSFVFSFDDYLTDDCIIYDVNNPSKFACNEGYYLNSIEYKKIIALGKLIIKTKGNLKINKWY